MRKCITVAAACLSALTISTGALAEDEPSQQAPQSAPPAHVSRVGKKVTNPRRHIKLVRHFTPVAKPTPAFMLNVIIPLEAARWNVSRSWLSGRIACESHYRYWAANPSGAKGAGQFMDSTWARALHVFPTSVLLVSERSRLLHRRVVLLYSDGSQRVVKGRLVRQRVTIVQRGHLPRWPSVYHGWANVRAAARAMAGLGDVGADEWSCA